MYEAFLNIEPEKNSEVKSECLKVPLIDHYFDLIQDKKMKAHFFVRMVGKFQ